MWHASPGRHFEVDTLKELIPFPSAIYVTLEEHTPNVVHPFLLPKRESDKKHIGFENKKRVGKVEKST